MATAKQSKNSILVAFGVLAVIICIVAICAFAGVFYLFPSTPQTVDDYINEYGGNPDVYTRILALSDCSLLQEQFDIAAENNERAAPGTSEHRETTGYMVAADERMKTLDCYNQSNVSQLIAQTAEMAVSLTALAITPTALITSTSLPTLTPPITFTPQETAVPTHTVVFVLPTNPPAAGSCSCAADTLNCSDFSSQSSAQACMNHCVSIGMGDIHNLDGNADGAACESLP